MNLILSEVAIMVGAVPPSLERPVTGYSIDSRPLAAGDLFFAIRGSQRDGHEYVAAALERGASGAVVEQSWALSHPEVSPLIRVADPAAALGRLARQTRRRWAKPIVAVTGSNGKTTTKELIAAALSTAHRVGKSEGNLNNELGVPLSLLRFDSSDELGVVEMGMNHGGEIARLTQIAEPTVGVVTNVNAAHLEHFSSIDEIASAKRELIEGLPPDGVAVLNADDERVNAFSEVHSGKVITFGQTPAADFQAVDIESRGLEGVRFRLRSERGSAADSGAVFESPLVGVHNVSNILAAIATASIFDIRPAELQDAVAGFRAGKMRGEVLHLSDVVILNDCYNSNPAAAVQMLRVVRESAAARRIAVLGEMLELGPDSPELHRRVGRDVAQGGLDILVTVAGQAEEIAEEAIRCGFPRRSVHFFQDVEQAGSFLAAAIQPGDLVLFKASRGVGLERALDDVIRVVGVRDAEATATKS